MDKRKSVINVSVSVLFKFLLLVVSLLTRRTLIKYIGNDANGIDSLYTSVIGILSIAELGIGGAIAFSMYKPIVDGDNKKVSALYNLFKKLYLVIALIILAFGICVMPLLPILTKGYNADFNLYLTFFIMLISVVLTYSYSAKISLINAYKNNYVTTTIISVATIAQEILQMILLAIFQSFTLYLLCRMVAVLIQWIWTTIYTNKMHKEIIISKDKIDTDTRKEVIRNSKAMFMHKIGGLLVNTIDSIIISSFIGVTILGKYSNYTIIITAMTSVITLIFTSLTSIVGHLCAKKDKNEELRYFNFFHCFSYLVGVIFFLGYYMVIDDLISICFETANSGSLILSKNISFIITLNYFIQFMRQVALLFRDATGTFYHDRFKPLLEGTTNLILSILFVLLFPSGYEVLGVIVATIVTNLFICHIIEPYVLYRYGFQSSVKKYYLNNYTYILTFALLLIFTSFMRLEFNNVWIDLLINGCIAVFVSLIPMIFIFIFNKKFREDFKKLLSFLTSKFKKKRTSN